MHLPGVTSTYRGRSPGRALLLAIAAPAAATAIAFPVNRGHGGSADLLYLLGVVVAAALGGLWSGLGAAAISFFAFTYFFTEPRHTFRVERLEDVVTAVVLLAVAVVVGSLLARALEERERAGRRERDARLLGYLSTKLLSGERLEKVLSDFAEALMDPFALARCEISARLGDADVRVNAERPGLRPGAAEVVPIAIGPTELGSIVAVRSDPAGPMGRQELELLDAAAKQAGAALERAHLDQQVRGAQLEAETNELRAALFSSVTHDLRTPLASIKAGVTSLLDEDATHDPAQERELLTTVLEETDRLNRLVGDLMDLARIRAGALTPAREPASMDEIVEAVLTRLRPRLQAFRVRTVLRPDLPEVLVDPMQIDQVLTNLLENATAHSPAGGEILVSAAPYRGVVQVRVCDQGQGIPPQERDKVFEAFYRGSRDGSTTGTGLGLAIAQAIVLAHGGRIWVEGAPGGGTAAVFEVPGTLEQA